MAAEERDGDADFVAPNTRADQALDIASVATSAVPWIGGPISAVLSGVSFGRKIDRVREVVNELVGDLRDFKSEVSEKYVQTDEFQDLLEATLKRVSEEPTEARRVLYREFIINVIRRPAQTYDEQLSVLRAIGELSPDQFRLLEAIAVDPGRPTSDGGIGSRGQTLSKRAGLPRDRIDELVADLNMRRLTNLQGLHTNMTAHGAEDLRHAITPFGQRVLDAISVKRA
jgi:hypothetical protein